MIICQGYNLFGASEIKTEYLNILFKNPKLEIDLKQDYGKGNEFVKAEYLRRKRNLEKLYLIAKPE
jgi:hypothetical protein